MLPSGVTFENFWGRKRKYFYGRSRKAFPENREAYFGESHGNSFIVRNGPAFGTASKLAEEANSNSNHDYLKSAKIQDTEHFEGEKQWDDFLYNCIGTISFLSPKNPNPDQSKVVRPKLESREVRRQKLKWRQKKQNEKEKLEKKDLSWKTVQEQPISPFTRGSFPKIRLRTDNQEESKSFDEDKEFNDQYLATYFDARELLEDFDDFSLMKVASDSDENSHKERRNSRGNKKFKNKEGHKGNKKNYNGSHKNKKKSFENVENNVQPSNKFQNAKKNSPFPENILLHCDDNEKPWTNPPFSKNANVFHKKQNKIFNKVEDNEQFSSKFQTGQRISETWPENVLLQCGDNKKAWTNPLLNRRGALSAKIRGATFVKESSNNSKEDRASRRTRSGRSWGAISCNGDIDYQLPDSVTRTTNWPEEYLGLSTLQVESKQKNIYSMKPRFIPPNKKQVINSLAKLVQNNLSYNENLTRSRFKYGNKNWVGTNLASFKTSTKECSIKETNFEDAYNNEETSIEDNIFKNTYFSEKLPYIVKTAANWDINEETFNLTGTKTITSTPNKETVTTGSTTIHTSEDNLKNGSEYKNFPKEDGDTSPKSISETEPKENFKLSDIIGKISRRYIRGRRIWNGWCYTEEESSYRPFIQKLLSESARRNEKQNGAKSSISEENFNKLKLEDATVDDDPVTAIAKINSVEEEDATIHDPPTVIAKIHLIEEEDSTVDEDLPLVIAKMKLVEESDITVDEDLSTAIAKINLAKDHQRRTVEEKAITSSVSCTILKDGKNTSPKKTVRFDTNENKIHKITYNEVVEEPPMRKPVYSRGQIRGRRVLDCKPLI